MAISKEDLIKAGGKGGMEVSLWLLTFVEENVIFIYSPALDLTGYGYTEKEAKRSFEETLTEFLKYTTNKKTLLAELKRLGWSIEKEKIKSQPTLVDMVNKNDYLKDIFEHKPYTKYLESVHLPAA